LLHHHSARKKCQLSIPVVNLALDASPFEGVAELPQAGYTSLDPAVVSNSAKNRHGSKRVAGAAGIPLTAGLLVLSLQEAR
jgi:hypothetical protein